MTSKPSSSRRRNTRLNPPSANCLLATRCCRPTDSAAICRRLETLSGRYRSSKFFRSLYLNVQKQETREVYSHRPEVYEKNRLSSLATSQNGNDTNSLAICALATFAEVERFRTETEWP